MKGNSSSLEMESSCSGRIMTDVYMTHVRSH